MLLLKSDIDGITGLEEKAEALRKIRGLERSISDSLKKEDRKPYNQEVVDMWSKYESKIFWLSEHSKNETIESLKRMSLGQMLKFEELTHKKLKQQKKNVRG